MSDVGAIAGTVFRVLTSSAVQRINFHFGTIHVDGTGLAAIGYLVIKAAAGEPGIRIEVVRYMDERVGAQYSPKENALKFRRVNFGGTSIEEATIVHECVHSLQDIYGGDVYPSDRGSKFVTESENEAAAYVAGQLYLIYKTGKPSGGSNIRYISGQIAQRIKDQPGAFVSIQEMDALRREIVDTNIYEINYKTPTFSDGP